MERKKIKNSLKWFVKLALSGLALYIVFGKIDRVEAISIFSKIQFPYLILAIAFFNLSQIISAFRYRKFLGIAGIPISQSENIKLYYLGMFYNLFLPGGIGGDGYKIMALKKRFHKSWKPIFKATVIDRISGAVALCFLTLSMVYLNAILLNQSFKYPFLLPIVAIGLFPSFLLFLKYLFKDFTKVFLTTSSQSLTVQLAQVGCAYFILEAMQVQDSVMVGYLTLFLVSGIVAIIPFTIGGLGARELVFVYGGQFFLMVDINIAVNFGLLFFVITALSSLPGSLFEFK
ncbi:lysylphosphatidylglycerol synthase transmembrane domain-containing protein [Fulvivirgaceae bacterium BMA10]|uniref:Lysylphosphatidylglycerol synthase transmembrane domain-containing protein n=1 Tax=Splendidivirga corallicola TaxID=3051826 RepID=A0ABT8KXQ2_9BACT|nr:lysylphosphatidylglycerol synthase transmembrane domain-containing protein [Fulvivirgaceae bacterium BMA10]